MTVGELRELLADLPEDLDLYFDDQFITSAKVYHDFAERPLWVDLH